MRWGLNYNLSQFAVHKFLKKFSSNGKNSQQSYHGWIKQKKNHIFPLFIYILSKEEIIDNEKMQFLLPR